MSTARFDTLENVAGSKSVPVSTVVDGSAKAWVNFNGTGTVAIRASFNVSSITDNGVGDYTVNFTSALADANYAFAGSARRTGFPQGGMVNPPDGGTYTSSAIQISVRDDGGTAIDPPIANVAFFR